MMISLPRFLLHGDDISISDDDWYLQLFCGAPK